MKRWLNILIVFCLLLTACSVRAEDRPTLPKEPEKFDIDAYNKRMYQDFLKIKVFDKSLMCVSVYDEKIGLKCKEVNRLFKTQS